MTQTTAAPSTPGYLYPRITGTTRIYAHLAHPSDHVRTPQILNTAFAERGLDAAAISIDVAPQDLAGVVSAFRGWRNLAGAGVTMPHKRTIMQHLDELSVRARQVGAVNIVRRAEDGRLHGDNIDGAGFITGLVAAGHDPRGRSTLLVGAGGAGRAIAFALLESGVDELTVANRDAGRGADLVAELRAAYPDAAVRSGPAVAHAHTLVVNATSVGMRQGQPLPVDLTDLAPASVVADIIMSPPTTALLHYAAEVGAATVPGLPMLAAQVDLIVAQLHLLAYQPGTVAEDR